MLIFSYSFSGSIPGIFGILLCGAAIARAPTTARSSSSARRRRPSRGLFYYDPLRGWGPFATGGIDLRAVPGRHIDLLREPHVCAVAAELAGNAS